MGKNNLITTNPSAVEIFSAGWCNLDCKYCYISKIDNNVLKSIHNNILENIKNKKLINFLKKYYKKENLKSISHWGTEPTLTIDKFVTFYKDVIKEFPNLSEIHFSSNFMTDINKLIYFLENLPKKFNIYIQISLDGDRYTDKNRKNDAHKIIVKNLLQLIKYINKNNIKHKIFMNFKSTLSKEDFEDFINYAENYYLFFDNLIDEIKKINSKIIFNYSIDPTIVIPDNYTSKDGKNFLKIYEKILKLQNKKFKHITPKFNYFYRFKSFIELKDEFYTKSKMFICSAGDSSFGLDNKGNLLPCHRGYYFHNNKYLENLKNDERINKLNKIDMNKIKYFKKNYIVNKNLNKFLILNRSYQDFVKLAINSVFIRGIELAKAGLISKIYLKKPEFLKLFAEFMFKISCPMENTLKSNSIFINDTNLIILFCNGVFELIIREYLKSKGGKNV